MVVGDVMNELAVGRGLILDVCRLVDASGERPVGRLLRGFMIGASKAVLRGHSWDVASVA